MIQIIGNWRVYGAAFAGVALAMAGAALFERKPASTVHPATAAAMATAPAPTHRARALTAAEDVYAHALWPIHSELKLNAVRMTFAGINYATDDRDTQKLAGKLEPLIAGFGATVAKIQALRIPQSLRDTHEHYLEAATLYEAASREMVKIVATGDEEHLRKAHAMSQRAAENLLRVGEVLWPAEHKPH